MVCEELCKGALATPVDTFVYHNSFVPLRISTPKRVFEIKSKDTYKYNWWWAIRDLNYTEKYPEITISIDVKHVLGFLSSYSKQEYKYVPIDDTMPVTKTSLDLDPISNHLNTEITSKMFEEISSDEGNEHHNNIANMSYDDVLNYVRENKQKIINMLNKDMGSLFYGFNDNPTLSQFFKNYRKHHHIFQISDDAGDTPLDLSDCSDVLDL